MVGVGVWYKKLLDSANFCFTFFVLPSFFDVFTDGGGVGIIEIETNLSFELNLELRLKLSLSKVNYL